jgi:hypothetical protein
MVLSLVVSKGETSAMKKVDSKDVVMVVVKVDELVNCEVVLLEIR